MEGLFSPKARPVRRALAPAAGTGAGAGAANPFGSPKPQPRRLAAAAAAAPAAEVPMRRDPYGIFSPFPSPALAAAPAPAPPPSLASNLYSLPNSLSLSPNSGYNHGLHPNVGFVPRNKTRKLERQPLPQPSERPNIKREQAYNGPKNLKPTLSIPNARRRRSSRKARPATRRARKVNRR